MRTIPRIALFLTVAAGSLVAAGAVVFRKSAVERRVEDLLASALRAPAHFAEATFSTTDGLVVRELVILDPRDPLAPPLVRIETAHIDLQFGRPGRLVDVDGIELQGLHARVQREGGAFRLAELIVDTGGETAEVPSIIVDGGTLTYSDDEVFDPGVALELELERATYLPTSLDGDLPPRERRRFDFKGRSDATGRVHVTATRLSHGRVDVAVRLGAVALDSAVVHGLAGAHGDTVDAYAPEGEVAVEELSIAFVDGAEPQFGGTFRAREVALRLALPGADEPLGVSRLSGLVRLAGDVVTIPEGERERVHALLGGAGGQIAAWGRVSDLGGGDGPRLDLHAEVRAARLDASLHPRLPADVVAFLHEFEITGTCDVDGTVNGAAAQPDVAVAARLRDATFNYVGVPSGPNGELDGFPWKVDVSRGDVRYADRELTYDATATRGTARVVSTGTVRWNDEGENESRIDVTGYDVPLDASLRSALGSSAADYFDPFAPSGTVAEVRVRVRRLFEPRPIEGVAEYDIVLDGRAGFRPREFPTDLRDVRGEIELRRPPGPEGRAVETRLRDIAATGDGFELSVDAVLRDDEDLTKQHFRAVADVDDLAGAFRTALLASTEVPDDVKETVAAVRAGGKARVELNDDTEGTRVAIELKGVGTPGWDDVPIAMEGLLGTVRIGPDGVDLEQIRGRALGTSIRADGEIVEVDGETVVELEVAAPELPLGPSLRAGLGHFADPIEAIWTDAVPAADASADVFLTLRRDGNHACEARNLRGGFAPLGLPLAIRAGELRFADGKARLTADARLGHAEGTIHEFELDTEGGGFTVLADFKGLHFPEDLAGVLPQETIDEILATARARTLHGRGLRLVSRPAARELELQGEIDVRPRSRQMSRDSAFDLEGILDVRPLRIVQDADGEGAELAGEVGLREFAIRAGVEITDLSADAVLDGRFGTDARRTTLTLSGTQFRAYDRKVTDASLVLDIGEDALRIRKFNGALAGGRLRGRFTAGEHGAGSYYGNLRLSSARGERFFHATKDERIEGDLQAAVKFRNDDGRDESLTGEGSISLRDGRFLNVPVFIQTLRVWDTLQNKLGVKDGGDKFRRFTLEFDLQGPWLRVKDFEMRSDALEIVGGTGRIGLDGRLDLTVDPRFSPGVYGVDTIWNLLQNGLQLLTDADFRVTGTLRNPNVELVPLSFLDPKGAGGPDAEPQPTDDLEGAERDPW